MIAIDTNILVYAHREDVDEHRFAKSALEQLALSGTQWCIPWPCAHEFIAAVTHSRWSSPTPIAVAVGAIESWLAHPTCRPLSESVNHLELLSGLAQRASLKGAAIHDARIAAICIGAGVTVLWTRDRDFQKFPDLQTRNPLIPSLYEPIAAYRQSITKQTATTPSK
jgi:uncharacterized protein